MSGEKMPKLDLGQHFWHQRDALCWRFPLINKCCVAFVCSKKKLRALYGKWVDALYSYDMSVWERYQEAVKNKTVSQSESTSQSDVVRSSCCQQRWSGCSNAKREKCLFWWLWADSTCWWEDRTHAIEITVFSSMTWNITRKLPGGVSPPLFPSWVSVWCQLASSFP